MPARCCQVLGRSVKNLAYHLFNVPYIMMSCIYITDILLVKESA